MEQFVFLGIGLPAWITIASLVAIMVALARTHAPLEVVYLGAVTVLLVTGVVDEEEAMGGFASEPVIVHAAFFVVIAGLIQTGVLYWLSKNVLGRPGNYRLSIIRLVVPVSVLAAFLNGTNTVAMFIDTVKIWARTLNMNPSRLLLPMSYAASFGGMCTLLGNTSNLVISGLYLEKTGNSLHIFAPLLPGLILTVVGTFLVVILRNFIPKRESSEQSFETTSDYTVELLVPTENQAVGKTVQEAGLKQVNGGSLIEIVRFDKEIIMPVPDDEFVLGGDRLIYAGQINEILQLKKSHGLVAADHHVYDISEIGSDRKLRTAYVTFGSDLIGTSMSTNDFEHQNDMALVAVARQGKRVEGQPREVRLQAGDTLLLECPPKSVDQLEKVNRRNLQFFDSHFVPQLSKRTITAALILVLMFVISSFHIMPLMASTMLASGAMLLTKCCRMDRIVKYIEWDLLLVLGSTVVLSTAFSNTGIASAIADGALQLFGTNPYVVMCVTCFLASLVTQFVTDVGCAAIFFPIVWHQAMILGCNPMPFVMSLMLSVTFSYSTPIGSTNNMLIFGPGSFRVGDFARLGIVLHLVLFVLMMVVVNLIYPI
ncbi:MAG: SLC13 family permease [Prevotella sp.]|nr:SLC13 family permease [Prevotella sp.]